MLTDSQRRALQDAIAADPALQALANTADDIGLAAALNAKTIDGDVPLPTAEAKRHAILEGYYGAIVLASRGDNAAAIAAIGYVDDPRYTLIDLTLPAVQAMIAGLVTSGAMSQAQADSLVAMGRGKLSLAEQICGLGVALDSQDAGELR